MSVPEDRVDVIRAWIQKAENDLRSAVHILTMGKKAPPDTVGFHSQQCIEKYLKALLISQGIPFPKTHDLPTLFKLIPAVYRPEMDQGLQGRVTEYATVIRYPNVGTEVSLAEARSAVALARRIRKEVRRHLPRAALRRPKK